MRMSKRQVNKVIAKAREKLLKDYQDFRTVDIGTVLIPPEVEDLFSLFNLILTYKVTVEDK